VGGIGTYMTCHISEFLLFFTIIITAKKFNKPSTNATKTWYS